MTFIMQCVGCHNLICMHRFTLIRRIAYMVLYDVHHAVSDVIIWFACIDLI